jgi:hypothetical protein
MMPEYGMVAIPGQYGRARGGGDLSRLKRQQEAGKTA